MNFKIIFLVFFVTICCYSQNPAPVPIPSLDPAKVVGRWYVVMQYDPYIKSKTLDITCWTWTFNYENGVVGLFDTYLENKYNYTAGTTYSFVNKGKSVWQDNNTGSELVWIDVDPINLSWALIGFEDLQLAFLISRSPSVLRTLIDAQNIILKVDQYRVDSTNHYIIDNSKCS